MKYRKKSVVIDAICYTGNNLSEVLTTLKIPEIGQDFLTSDLLIDTLEGEMRVMEGDYIIKGIAGEFYPCKSDIFEASYDKVEND